MPRSHGYRHYLLSGSLWVLAGKVTTILSMMGLYVLVARAFPPEVTGVYFLALNMATFFAFFAQFGIGYTVVRIASELRAEGKDDCIYEFIKISLMVFLSTCLLTACWYVILHHYLLGELFFLDNSLLFGMLIAAWLVLLAIQFNLGEFFRAFRLMHYSAMFSGSISAILAVSFLLFWVRFSWHENNIILIFYCIIFALFVNAILGFVIFYRYIKKYNYNFKNRHKYDAREVLGQSFPYMLSLVAFFVTGQSDVWLTGLYLEKSEVALYAAAARIVLLTNLFLVVVESVIAPLIAEMNSKGQRQALEKLLRKTATIVFFPAIIVFLLFALFGDQILLLLYGKFYAGGYHSLLILAVAQMVIIFTGSCGPLLLMTGHQKVVMKIAFFTAALTIIMGMILIPWLGKEGAAYAILISFVVQQWLRILYIRKHLGMTTLVDIRLFPGFFRSLKAFYR